LIDQPINYTELGAMIRANLRPAGDLEPSLPAAAVSLEQSLDRLVAAIQTAGRELRRARVEYELVIQAARHAEHELSASATFACLTKQERRIALLAMAGSSDAEAAVATHLSVHTVKTHMKSVLRKLALHSRWQLAQLLADGADRSLA
jgi:DNA-binding NarL/FixJ family response regulator